GLESCARATEGRNCATAVWVILIGCSRGGGRYETGGIWWRTRRRSGRRCLNVRQLQTVLIKSQIGNGPKLTDLYAPRLFVNFKDFDVPIALSFGQHKSLFLGSLTDLDREGGFEQGAL